MPLRKRYQLLLDRRGGVAVVEARNGACLGCNMHLPPQLFNSLYLAKEVQTCPHCNRLLYVEKEPALKDILQGHCGKIDFGWSEKTR